MIHDFATAPRQPDWRLERKEVLKEQLNSVPGGQSGGRRLPVNAVLLTVLVVVSVFAVTLHFNSGDPALDSLPDEAAKQEYVKAVLEVEAEAVRFDAPAMLSSKSDIADPQVSVSVELPKKVERHVEGEQLSVVGMGSEAVPEPDFEFYDSLKEDSWPIQVQNGVYVDGQLADRDQPVYNLQAASFRDKSDAYSLLSKLSKRKLNGVVRQSVSSSGEYWYQVSVGPFVSTSKLNKAQDILVSMNMMPLKKRVQ